jgi:hypothetical protein
LAPTATSLKHCSTRLVTRPAWRVMPAGQQHLWMAARPAPAPQHVDEHTHPDDVRSHYAIDEYDLRLSYDGHGVAVTARSRAAIRATSPGIAFYYSGQALENARHPGGLVIGEVRRAQVERINTSLAGALDVYFRLDRILTPDDSEPHQVVFEVNLAPDGTADPMIIYSTRAGIRAHSLEATFTPPAVPERLWCFAARDTYDIDKPRAEDFLRPVDSTPTYRHRFTPIIAGRVYGFCWTWSPHWRDARL